QVVRSGDRDGVQREMTRYVLALVVAGGTMLVAQNRTIEPDWKTVDPETLKHFQAVVRFDTTAKEKPLAEYIKQVLDENGVPAQVVAMEPDRPNVVARLKGSGRKKPLLIMGHTDTVSVDLSKWKFGPFSAALDGGYVYGRGTIDDKDNLTAGLMTMILLKRLNVPLDRDVIFLSEPGEEGGGGNVGIAFMVKEHFPDIEAEYCLAEGAGLPRIHPEPKFPQVHTLA